MEEERTIEPTNEPAVGRLRLAMTLIPLLALLGCFAHWLLTNTHPRVLGIVAAAAITLLFALLGVRFIPQWIEAWSGAPETLFRACEGRRSGRRQRMHPFFKIVLAVLLSRLLLFALAYILVAVRDGYAGGIFDRMDIWNPVGIDSRHYLSIAEFGYQTEGDARLQLVFLPFYPLVVRLFQYVFQDFLVSGLFVSNVSFLFAAYLLYELALLDMDRRGALRAVKYICILPASCLFCTPMSDGLFLLLAVSCMYLTRRKLYVPACVVGFFAAFTRVPGLLLLVPVCFELVGDLVRDVRVGAQGRRFVLSAVGRCLSLLLIPLGFGLFLFLNYRLTGDWFRFLQYQQENWSQSMGWFFNTAEYQTVYALNAAREGSETLYGLWLPNLVYLFGALALVIAAQKRLRPSYVAYFIVYYAVTMGATWLLSAPRYLTAAFPLALSLAALTEKRWADAVATLVCVAGLLFYLFAFLQRWAVY